MVLTGIVSVQVGGAVAATLFDRVGPLGVVVLRLVSAALVMLLWVRPWRRTWSRADVRVVLGFGAVLGAMNMTFYESLDRLPLGAAVTLEVLGPLTVAVLSGRRWRDGLWAVLAFTGVLALGGGDLDLDPVGVLFGLGAAVCWGLYILLSVVTGRRFTGLADAVPGLVTAVQAVDDAARFHVDLETDDVPAEVARLSALGAAEVAVWEGCHTMRAPGGHLLCVIPLHSDPDDFAAHSRVWP